VGNDVIRILHVVTIMDRGGIETMLMNYYRNIDRTKFQFDFLVHRPQKGLYEDEIESLGGRIYRVSPIHPKYFNVYFKELDTFFREHKEYKIVHSHIDTLSSFALRAAKKNNVPVRIAHSHSAKLDVDIKLPMRLYSRHIMKNYATDYMACSKKAAKWLFGKNSEKAIIVNNSTDIQKFDFSSELRIKYRDELGLGDKKVITNVSRFFKPKNHTFIIDIFNEIHKRDKNTALVLIGDGELRPKIEEKVEMLGLTDSVIFTGIREDVPGLLSAMDIFLFPSICEGFGLALLEAQISGLWCASSDTVPSNTDMGLGIIEYISLKKSAVYWAERILQMDISNRVSKIDKIRELGFDIKDSAEKLCDFYYKKCKE